MPTKLQDARRLSAACPLPELCFDSEHGCEYANPSFLELTGLSEREVTGGGWATALHADDVEDIEPTWQALDSEGGSVDLELRVVVGVEPRWMRLIIYPISDADGRTLGYMGQFVDIHDLYTERLRSEHRREMLELTDGLMSVGHWHMDVEKGTVLWSEEVFRIYGLARREGPDPERALACCRPEDAERVRTALAEMAPGDSFSHEVPMTRPDGEPRIIRAAFVAALNETGGRVFSGVIQDVTAQRNLLDRLASSEERYTLAMRASRDGLWDWDLSTGQLWISESFRRLFGFSREKKSIELYDLETRVHMDHRALLTRALSDHLDRRTPLQVSVRIQKRSGAWLWVRVSGHGCWDGAGRPVRIVGTISDIDREMSESEFNRARALELSRDRARLGRAAGKVASDVQLILQKIRPIAQLVSRRAESGGGQPDEALDRLASLSMEAVALLPALERLRPSETEDLSA